MAVGLGDKRKTAMSMIKALRGLRAAIDTALREGRAVYERDA